jgi:Flp pilus assembly protein TadB
MNQEQRLASEKVVVAAPMSLTGSTIRIWRGIGERGAAWWSRTLYVTSAMVALLIAWVVILCWYAIFGLLLVPYRVGRRRSRKRKVTALQHRETLTAIRPDEDKP